MDQVPRMCRKVCSGIFVEEERSLPVRKIRGFPPARYFLAEKPRASCAGRALLHAPADSAGGCALLQKKNDGPIPARCTRRGISASPPFHVPLDLRNANSNGEDRFRSVEPARCSPTMTSGSGVRAAPPPPPRPLLKKRQALPHLVMSFACALEQPRTDKRDSVFFQGITGE